MCVYERECVCVCIPMQLCDGSQWRFHKGDDEDNNDNDDDNDGVYTWWQVIGHGMARPFWKTLSMYVCMCVCMLFLIFGFWTEFLLSEELHLWG